MLLYHSFDRLTVDTGLACSAPHMAIMSLQQFYEETSFPRADGRLFGVLE